MRLGIVPYSNCLPLVHGIACEIFKAPPSRLAEEAGPDDIIMAPIVTPFFDPSWHLLEGAGIGSFGPVETVKLFYRKNGATIQNIKLIYSDSDSLTSLNLLKILLQYRFERDLAGIAFSNDRHHADVEGALLIGDKCWLEEAFTPSLDLGACWSEWTDLPFVYACWMTKNRAVGLEWKERLVKQAQSNLRNLENISQEPSLLQYWKKLHYDLGEPQKEAVALFQKYWASLNGKPLSPLQWV